MPELRPYQREDAEFIKAHPTCGIFNEQRTGKTPTVLVALNELNIKKIIVVCPASTIPQWKEEYELWTGNPCVAILGKTKAKRDKEIAEWSHGIIISYDTFKTTTSHDGLYAALLKQKPEAIILDEAHRTKNHKSKLFATINKCLKIPRRLALTGTPAPNKAYEVYSILHFLFPSNFNSYWKFIDEYFMKTTQFAKGTRTYIEILGFKPGKEAQLQNILNATCTQRKRKEVMQWLPDKDYQQIKLEPTPMQKIYIDSLLKYFETPQGEIITKTILDRLVRIRQICVDPAILGLKSEPSPKTEWVKQYIKDYPDTSTIIFSKSTKYILKLKNDLEDEFCDIIVGATPIEERNRLKKDFQKGKIKRIIINIDVGKEGLTLDKAETMIFTDKYPPAGDIAQAEDRFVSTTEDKANKPHLIIELMIKDTYDEQLYTLIKQRFSETDVINDFKKYIEERRK